MVASRSTKATVFTLLFKQFLIAHIMSKLTETLYLCHNHSSLSYFVGSNLLRISLGDYFIFLQSYVLMSCSFPDISNSSKGKDVLFWPLQSPLVTFHMNSYEWKQLIKVSIASSDNVFEFFFYICHLVYPSQQLFFKEHNILLNFVYIFFVCFCKFNSSRHIIKSNVL